MDMIYVAGLYSRNGEGLPATPAEIEVNVAHAARLAAKLWDAGWSVICPHCNTHQVAQYAKTMTGEKWVDGDIEQILRCDAIFMLHGWKKSPGAQREREAAQAYGLRVYYEDDPTDLILLGIKEEE